MLHIYIYREREREPQSMLHMALLLITLTAAQVLLAGSKVPEHRVSMVSVSGVVIIVWGVYLMFGYLDPLGCFNSCHKGLLQMHQGPTGVFIKGMLLEGGLTESTTEMDPGVRHLLITSRYLLMEPSLRPGSSKAVEVLTGLGFRV